MERNFSKIRNGVNDSKESKIKTMMKDGETFYGRRMAYGFSFVLYFYTIYVSVAFSGCSCLQLNIMVQTYLHCIYSRTSMAQTSLGPWKFVRDMSSSSL